MGSGLSSTATALHDEHNGAVADDDRLRVDVLGPIRAFDPEGRDVTPDGVLRRRLLALLVLGGSRRHDGRRRRCPLAGDSRRDRWPRCRTTSSRLRRVLPRP